MSTITRQENYDFCMTMLRFAMKNANKQRKLALRASNEELVSFHLKRMDFWLKDTALWSESAQK